MRRDQDMTQRPNPNMTRRRLLGAGTALALTGRGTVRAGASSRPSANVRMRPDLLDPGAPRDAEIIQITTDPDVPSCHVYMEAQIFTPDSRRLVLHRSADAHNSDRNDPRHQYLLCDLENGFALHPLTAETGATSPSVSPDGKYLYYFVDRTGSGTGPLTLQRVRLDGTGRQTILVMDSTVPGTRFRLSEVYPLSTISSDGAKLAISACLDRSVTPIVYGLLVIDLREASVQVVIHGHDWFNMHPQFCRSTDPMMKRDILIQHDHGSRRTPGGDFLPPDDRLGVDIHVIRDDGTNLRDMPWGRDGTEFCEGHQCWRGRTGWAITSVGRRPDCYLIESQPVAADGHRGLHSPGAVRNLLSRGFEKPRFHHFAVDLHGRHVITDYGGTTDDSRIYLARLGAPGRDAWSDVKCLARPRPSGRNEAHTHPFLSPDGAWAFFNSDESGQLQAYAIRGLTA